MIALLGNAEYKSLVEGIASLRPCPVAGVVTTDQIKIMLCEHDILPASTAALEAD